MSGVERHLEGFSIKMDPSEEQADTFERHFDRQLSETVKKYPCLYDKRHKGFHGKPVVDNAWLSVAEKLKLQDGEEAKRLFENLKKRYNKSKNAVKKLQYLGGSEMDLSIARKNLEKYKFLSWLIPHIKVRRLKTLSPVQFAAVTACPVEDQSNTTTHSQELCCEYEKLQNELQLEDEIRSCPEDSIDLFARLIAADMRSLSSRNQLIAKNQIQNLIFNLLMEQEEQNKH